MLNLLKRKKDFEDLEQYEDYEDLDTTKIYNNPLKEKEEYSEEPRIIESYPTTEDSSYDSYKDEYEDFHLEEDESDNHNRTNKKAKRIINVVFCVIIAICLMVTIDVICVSKLKVGPFFALRTNVYKDGGTKVYYGLGYKVIKYHQLQGRRDVELGNWSLQYNTQPIDTTDVDLAIAFENNPTKTSEKFYKKFVRLSGTIKEVDQSKNQLILEYFDEDGKYTLDIYCRMAEKDSNIGIFEKSNTVNIIGTIEEFRIKKATDPNIVRISGCFAENNVEAEIIELE